MANSQVQSGTINIRNVVLKSALNHSSDFNFVHINPGSLKSHLSEISSVIDGVDLHILAVSETWFNDKMNDNLLKIPGFYLFRHDRKKKRGGGVALYIRSNLKAKILFKSHSAFVEFLAVEIVNEMGSKLVFSVVYNPPANPRLDSLLRVMTDLTEKYENCIFAGDFNINFLKHNSATKKFQGTLSSLGLQCPSCEPTNFVQNKIPSQIDLVLVKNLTLLKTFSQLALGSFTSHDFLFGSYTFFTDKNARSTYSFRNLKAIDKPALCLAARNLNWDLVYTLANIDDKVSHVTNLFLQLLDSFAPIREVSIHENSKSHWFTDEVQRLKVPAVKANLLSSYKRMRNKITTLKRKLCAQNYMKLLDPNLPSSKLWKNLKEIGVTKNSSNTAEGFSTCEFNTYFSSVFSKPSVDEASFVSSINCDDTFDFSCVYDEEVHAAIMQIKTNAVGIDGIPGDFVKLLCPFVVPFMTHIVNACITHSYFPELWKVAIVRPIPKGTNPKSVSDFRPISILPCLSKVLERALKEQIQHYVDRKKLLCEFQSGFRSRHSTNTAMLKVVNDLAIGLESGRFSIIASLDFKKAFDLVDHKKLIGKMNEKFGFSKLACLFLQSYLSNRWQRVGVGGKVSKDVSVTSGTPQGGILSALLFSMFINDLSEIIDIGFHLYADDSQFHVSSTTITEGVQRMNNSLKLVLEWADKNALTINPSKSKVMIVTKKKSFLAPDVFIGNDPISYCNKMTSLGLVLVSELSWKPHVDQMCMSINFGLSMLRQSQHFTPKLTRKRLVQALLIPKLTYMSNIYMNCSRASWKQIDSCFNSCLRYVFALKKFDSISSYKNEIFGCNIECFVSYRACIFIFLLLKNKSPGYLYNELNFPRYPRNRALKTPARENVCNSKSFFVYGAHLWNSLSLKIRSIDSVEAFKQECLSYLTLERA